MDKDEAQIKVTELVQKYHGLTEKEIRAYNEANTKQGFILPLFQALGWDIFDTREVALEEAASNKRVDFAFKLKDVARFYLEAKPLKADLNNPDYIKQAITYAYNNGVTWAILTNFEELHLFNAQRSTPFIQLHYSEYLTSFDKLWLLSRTAVAEDALSKEATQYGALPPLIPIEERLFKQLRVWREELFNQIYHYNHEWLRDNQIDEIIQKLFNRLIFVRTAEDRKLEEKQLLSAVHQWEKAGHKNGQLAHALKQIFSYYNGYYDSDLFKLHLLDNEKLFIEEPTLARILNGLYEIPGGIADYDFSIIDADVLGRVYEQYLGYVASVIKEKAKEAQAKMDLGIATDTEFQITAKKQHRKEQGIYYTPKFVTSYIVKETVGRFLKEHTHNEILNMKILDPACGSGSFLIRAYDELLNYHADHKGKPASQLDQYERLPVLTRNIFGVDLDMQAVEIARLNLLLRSLAKRDLLPPLTDNIKRGNSLISGTEEKLKHYFGESWQDKHAFNWNEEFKDIMGGGGFDVVIGNPPYVGFQGFDEDKAYLRDHYSSCTGRFDVYIPFVEKGMTLLKPGGLLGFICPSNFMKRQHGRNLRQMLRTDCEIKQIVDFQDMQIFEGALNYTCILILRKQNPQKSYTFNYFPGDISANPIAVKQTLLPESGWVFRDNDSQIIVDRILASPHSLLGDLSESISEGIVTGENSVFVLPKSLAKDLALETDLCRSVIQGREIRRYFNDSPANVIIYPYTNAVGKALPIPEATMRKDHARTWNYLGSKKNQLSGRRYFDESPKGWYELWCERSFSQQLPSKIVVPELASNNRFAFCEENIFYLDTACGIILRNKGRSEYLFLLALLNSRLIEFYYKQTTVPKASGFYIYKTMFLNSLPIRKINFSNPTEKELHDNLVLLAERMLKLNKNLAPIRDIYSHERDELLNRIEKTDREIDNIVYDLYGLSEEERKIVEGAL